MATAQIFLAPIPVTSRIDNRPPNDSHSIPDTAWTYAMNEILLPLGVGSAFNGRFPDAQVPQTGNSVAVSDIASRIGAAVKTYRDADSAIGLDRKVSVGGWTFYYRYPDAYAIHVVANYALALNPISGTLPWHIEVPGTTHFFLVTAVARIAIPRS